MTLDLSKIKNVSLAVYTPFDPSVPLVRKGDTNRLIGSPSEYDGGLPTQVGLKRGHKLLADTL